MDVPRRYEGTYRIRFDEAGADGRLRPSGLLRYIQDIAWVHSETAGFDRTWYAERRLQWLIRCLELTVEAPARYGQEVQVSTQVIGWRRVWARRRSEVTAMDGSRLAWAIIDWVLLNDAGRPARIPGPIKAFADPAAAFTPAHVDLPPAPASASRTPTLVRPQDIDPVAHVNNAVYLDYLQEALLPLVGAERLAALPYTVRIEYIRPALPSMALVSVAWPRDDDWAWTLEDDEGCELARGWLRSSAAGDSPPADPQARPARRS